MALSLSSELRLTSSHGEFVVIKVTNWCQEITFIAEGKDELNVYINNKAITKAIKKFFPLEDCPEVMQLILNVANSEMKHNLMFK